MFQYEQCRIHWNSVIDIRTGMYRQCLLHKVQVTFLYILYSRRIYSLDWTAGLEYWTGLLD